MGDVHALPEVLVFIHAIQQNAAYTIRPASIDASTRRWVHTRVNQIRPVPMLAAVLHSKTWPGAPIVKRCSHGDSWNRAKAATQEGGVHFARRLFLVVHRRARRLRRLRGHLVDQSCSVQARSRHRIESNSRIEIR